MSLFIISSIINAGAGEINFHFHQFFLYKKIHGASGPGVYGKSIYLQGSFCLHNKTNRCLQDVWEYDILAICIKNMAILFYIDKRGLKWVNLS